MTQINIEKFESHSFDSMTKEACPFTQADSKVIQHIHNKDALAFWIYFQSLPPEWGINKAQIMRCFGVGQDVYKRTMSFLKRCKLIDYKKYRDETGAFFKTRIIVKNGSEFIPQCSDKTLCQSNHSKKEHNSIVPKTDTVEMSNESVASNHRCENPPSGDPHAWKPPSSIKKYGKKKQDLNNKLTTTTLDLDRIDLEPKDRAAGSRFSFDLSALEPYGFGESQKAQISHLGLNPDKIQESIDCYAAFLKTEKGMAITSKIGYFFAALRKSGGYFLAESKPEVTVKVDDNRRKVIQHVIENGDGRYDEFLNKSHCSGIDGIRI
jgi:hypothetical protein